MAGRHWVCFSRASFATPEKVLGYLSRYTHRIAISNDRLLDIGGGQVSFRYRDRKDGNRVKERTISANEFIGRFLQHVLPKGLPRMRHYGFLGIAAKPSGWRVAGKRSASRRRWRVRSCRPIGWSCCWY